VNDSTTACDPFGTGETEDYRVFINTAPTGTAASKAARVNVYPNPAMNQIFVQGLRAGDALYLSDISGKVIVVQQVLADGLHTMHMDGISSGLYFLTVKNPADGDTQTLRLIKQ
jgi:phage/plasmid primase-like uncharacterized protein